MIDPATRQEIVRGVCRSEGHGSLIERTEFASAHRRYICERGCGTDIYAIDTPATFAELTAITGSRLARATVRGQLEIWSD